MPRLLVVVFLVALVSIFFTLTSDVVFPDSLSLALNMVQLVVLVVVLDRLNSENRTP